jgi:hypothetical protein
MATCGVENTRLDRFVGDTEPIIGNLFVDNKSIIPTGTVELRIYEPDTTDFTVAPKNTINGTVDAAGEITFLTDSIQAYAAGAYPYRIVVVDTYSTTFVSDLIVLR